MNVDSANFSVRSRRNQATKRGENSLVPNWTRSRTTEVTKPVKASIPLASAASAEVALAGLNSAQQDRVGLVPAHQDHAETSATITYIAGTNQRLCQTWPASRRRRIRLIVPANPLID